MTDPRELRTEQVSVRDILYALRHGENAVGYDGFNVEPGWQAEEPMQLVLTFETYKHDTWWLNGKYTVTVIDGEYRSLVVTSDGEGEVLIPWGELQGRPLETTQLLFTEVRVTSST